MSGLVKARVYNLWGRQAASQQLQPHTCRLGMHLQASTPVSVKATAGLRLLPGSKADDILNEVTAHLKKLPFTIAEGAVSILGGACPESHACVL